MAEREPVTELGAFSESAAVATRWSRARGELEAAQTYWLSTTRPDGRPHVTPLLGVWFDGAMYFSTGSDERKALNLTQNRNCVLTTGCNTLDDSLDVVVEGEAVQVGDDAERRNVADAFESKYGLRFTSPEGTWSGLGDSIRAGDVLVLRVVPTKVFGFGKGKMFSQTRYRFSPS